MIGLENRKLLEDIIRNNGDSEYNVDMIKYNHLNRQRLLKEGIPYNFYLLIRTTYNNGSEEKYAFIKLFKDSYFPYMQKLYLIELLDEVRNLNKKEEEQYGVVGKKAFLLNCDNADRMLKVYNTSKFQSIFPWIKEMVLKDGSDLDKYGNLKKCFYSEDFQLIEKRPIFPIMKLEDKSVTGKRGANGTTVTVIMGCPIELK